MDTSQACHPRLTSRACLRCVACLVCVACCVQLWLSAVGPAGDGAMVTGTLVHQGSFLAKNAPQPADGDAESDRANVCVTKRRRLSMLTNCLPFTNNSLQRRFVDSRVPVVSVESRYLHCPVAKAASTFWTRFVKSLNSSEVSPFSLSLDHRAPVRKNTRTLGDFPSRKEKLDFLKSAVKVVFVRDPYSRMFSSWVDKAFSPNPFYWTAWGTEAVRKFRKGATPKESFCGSDVTFAEVMALAASGMHMKDLHFHPVFTECQPCGFRYDFVGKMETFGRDLDRLTSCLNLSNGDYFRSQRFRQDYVRDAIEDSVNSPWGWLANISKCMTVSEAGKRVWRKLQIRGIISRRLPFPFTDLQSSSLAVETFVDAAFLAHRKSTDSSELQAQKREAFVEAYSTVDVGALLRLQKVFKEDFQMFGYDDRPPDVFGASSRPGVKKGAFRWDREWV